MLRDWLWNKGIEALNCLESIQKSLLEFISQHFTQHDVIYKTIKPINMKLEEAIQQILKQKGKPMTVAELTDSINAQQLCTRHDGTAICDFQVHGRSFNRNDLFERKGAVVKLIEK